MSRARFRLGMAQMAASTVAIVLLLGTGISAATLAATVFATAFMLVSRRRYHGQL
jgi:hypothetical protein